MTTRHEGAGVAWIPVLVVAAGLVGIAAAGDLEPPVPPGSPTMKSLIELEPRRPISAEMLPLTITDAASSWYLVESIATTGAGITVAAPDVTIDLNGFALSGGTGVGIKDDPAAVPMARNVTVRNGTVRGWSEQGIRLGHHSLILNVRAINNSGNGIEVGDESLVLGSLAMSNNLHGIVADGSTVIRDSVASHNTQNGFWGKSNVLIVHCTADNNFRNGIRVDNACHVRDSSVRGNSLGAVREYAGIWVQGDENRIEGNLAAHDENGYIIDGDRNVVVRNSSQYSFNDSFRINGSATGNLIGTVRTSLASAGPWDNLCTGTCP